MTMFCENIQNGTAGAGRRFAIVARSSLPSQLPLALSGPSVRALPQPRVRQPPRPASVLPSTLEATRPEPPAGDMIGILRHEIERRGEDLIVDGTGATPATWLSPTRMGLRYGDVCVAKGPDGAQTLVRVSSYRVPRKDRGEKRPYRRWFGLDLLAFLRGGVRREVRIAQVLKGSRC